MTPFDLSALRIPLFSPPSRGRQAPGWAGLQFEGPFRLNRKADRDVGGTVELLEHLVAKQATILALNAGPGRQLDAAIAGMAGGTADV